jgi:hypothetical protein
LGLSKDQYELLREEAQRNEESEAEYIRKALALWLPVFSRDRGRSILAQYKSYANQTGQQVESVLDKALVEFLETEIAAVYECMDEWLAATR